MARERSNEEYVSSREARTRGENFEEIEEMMREDGEIPVEPPREPDSAPNTPIKPPAPVVIETSSKKKHLYREVIDMDNNPMPEQFRHVSKVAQILKKSRKI